MLLFSYRIYRALWACSFSNSFHFTNEIISSIYVCGGHLQAAKWLIGLPRWKHLSKSFLAAAWSISPRRSPPPKQQRSHIPRGFKHSRLLCLHTAPRYFWISLRGKGRMRNFWKETLVKNWKRKHLKHITCIHEKVLGSCLSNLVLKRHTHISFKNVFIVWCEDWGGSEERIHRTKPIWDPVQFTIHLSSAWRGGGCLKASERGGFIFPQVTLIVAGAGAASCVQLLWYFVRFPNPFLKSNEAENLTTMIYVSSHYWYANLFY